MGRSHIRPKPASRVAETVVEYAASPVVEPSVYSVTMADRGRLVLPAEVRERLNINEGDRLAVILEQDGTIKLQTRAVAIRNLRGAFKHLAPGRSLVDELIAERRREAAMEERDARAFA